MRLQLVPARKAPADFLPQRVGDRCGQEHEWERSRHKAGQFSPDSCSQIAAGIRPIGAERRAEPALLYGRAGRSQERRLSRLSSKVVPKLPSPLLTTIGLVGGFAAARATGNRPLGGVVWASAGLLCLPGWRKAGPWRALLLGASYAGAMGGSHPLAKRVGAWPSVAIVSSSMAALGWALSGRGSVTAQSSKLGSRAVES